MTASTANSAIDFGPAWSGLHLPPLSRSTQPLSCRQNIGGDNTLDDLGTATSSKNMFPDKGKGKRVAPISSSAFSFSLAGPSKKSKSDEVSDNNNNNVAAPKLGLPTRAEPRHVPKTAQQASRTPMKAAVAAVTTPHRPELLSDASGAKVSPRLQAMGPPPGLTLTPKPQRTHAVQTTPTSARRAPPTLSLADASPKGLGSSQVTRPRPLNPVGGSPFRLAGMADKPKTESKLLQGITSLSQVKVSQALAPAHPAHAAAETAGVVSPRKRKSARKSG